MRKEWSKNEEQYLIDHAGKLPLADLSEIMGRSVASIKHKTMLLNREGHALSLRYVPPRTIPCPSCGKMRSRINRQGLCRCCELEEMIQKVNADMTSALSRMSVKQRDIYRVNDARLSSRVDAMPPAPVFPKKNPRAHKRIQEDYDIACEQVEIRNLERVLKARRRRYERMCGKFMKEKIFGTFPGQEGVLDENKPNKPQKRPNKQGHDPTAGG